METSSSSTFQQLCSLIHAVNPYENFSVDEYPTDLQGWGADHENFERVIERLKPSLIVEVGTWKGASAIHMAKCAERHDIRPTILCVDTWLGALEFWSDHKDPERYLSLNLNSGYPTVYYQFLANVVHSGFSQQIIPFPVTAQIAAKFLAKHAVRADMIYIDASHDFEDVYADIAAYFGVLRVGGIIFGDDFDQYWPSVKAAVRLFARINGLELRTCGRQWMIEKKSERPVLSLAETISSATDLLTSSGLEGFPMERRMKRESVNRICIVTPDIIGPVRNGGIGTHCYYLALELAKLDRTEVTVMFTGPYEQSSREQIIESFKKLNIEFCDMEDAPGCGFNRHGCEWFIDRSLRVKEFLAARRFTQVHFQDWQANGFATVQAKHTGVAFYDTLLTVTLHSSSQWVREGMKAWPHHPLQDAMLDYCERYVAQYADVVISPSEYMLNWAQSKGWKLADERKVMPYCFISSTDPKSAQSNAAIDYSHLIFFGRLETRKGLEMFTTGLERALSSSTAHGIKHVTFLGKIGNTQYGYDAGVHLENLRANLKKHAVEIDIVTDFSSIQANEFLVKARGVVFICSLQDNYPYTVIECLENRVPFIATKTGGIPELVSNEALFAPNINEMTKAIVNRAHHIAACSSKYDRSKALLLWSALGARTETAIKPELDVARKVSICVAYYNYGKYLPQLLESLAESSYPNFEVVAVNDGSTDASSVDVFNRMKEQYSNRGWQFISKPNEGIGATRNFAASHARGDYIIFMDADNIAGPRMIETFVSAMQASDADCLTCHFTAFAGDDAPELNFKPVYGYTPIGPCLEVGPIANVFGDANFCIRRRVFEQLGGFGADRTTSYEDYEFLARLALLGFKLDVIPEPIFFYRHLEGGFSRVTNLVANQQRVIATYMQHLDKLDANRLFNVLLTPLAKQVERFTGEIRSLHGERTELRKQLTDTQRQLSYYNRFGYRSTTKILRILDSHPGVKYVLRDSIRAVVRSGRWAMQAASSKGTHKPAL
ncbi:MAG: glycosyltransferase [Oligoflexia bacterium]|nr:glycosyltransferase [Oligoflexia bacterium]